MRHRIYVPAFDSLWFTDQTPNVFFGEGQKKVSLYNATRYDVDMTGRDPKMKEVTIYADDVLIESGEWEES